PDQHDDHEPQQFEMSTEPTALERKNDRKQVVRNSGEDKARDRGGDDRHLYHAQRDKGTDIDPERQAANNQVKEKLHRLAWPNLQLGFAVQLLCAIITAAEKALK